MRSHALTTAALLSLSLSLALTACDTDADLDMNPADAGAALEFAPGEAVEALPTHVLALEGGSSLSFFVDAHGGVAMLEEVPLEAGVASVLDDPWLEDASPAMVWYALAPESEPIPEALRVHHEALAARGALPPLAEALRDQPRDLAPLPLADDSSPCLNATFSTNHCAHPDYDDASCWFNVSGGNLTLNVSGAERYKAGFCLQEGQALSWLYYREEAPGCTYWTSLTFAWGINSYLFGDLYAAPTYRSYVWWSGSSGPRRIYSHHAAGQPGSVWDFGNRYTTRGCG